jgi:thiaminase/transcriptional activator TenA
MDFLEQLEQAVQPIYQEIISHPFNQELAEGTLGEEKFRFYLSQDTFYIGEYSRALAALAAKAPTHSQMMEFIQFAREGLDIDRTLHEEYFGIFGVSEPEQLALSTEAYSNFLLATAAYKSFEEAISALLPCFWLYNEVAVHIHQKAQKKDNKYQKWIDTYAGAEFDQTTGRLKEITRQLANESSQATRRKMQHQFLRSARYEWFFWDSAYNMRYW